MGTLCLSHCQFLSLRHLYLANLDPDYGSLQYGPTRLSLLNPAGGSLNLGVLQSIAILLPEHVDFEHQDFQELSFLLHFFRNDLKSLHLYGLKERIFDWPGDWNFSTLVHFSTDIHPHHLCKRVLGHFPSLRSLDFLRCKIIRASWSRSD